MLSAFTTTPPWRRARSRARADLPLAVGPVIRIAFMSSAGFPIMAFVATLIANPSNPVLSPSLAEQAAEAVKASGLYWLADGVACDLTLRDGSDLEAAEANILAVIAGLPIDLAIQEAEGRRKKLLIADMDSTMIGQ